MKRLVLCFVCVLGACTAPPGASVGIGSPSPVRVELTPEPSGEVGPVLEEECGLPEGCGPEPTMPPTDTP